MTPEQIANTLRVSVAEVLARAEPVRRDYALQLDSGEYVHALEAEFPLVGWTVAIQRSGTFTILRETSPEAENDLEPEAEPTDKPVATHCKRGHELTAANLYGRKNQCLTCRRDASAGWRTPRKRTG